MKIRLILPLFILFGLILQGQVAAQELRRFAPFTLPVNPSIKRLDTLRVGNAFSLDRNYSVGVVYCPSWYYMCLGVFSNAHKETVTAAFDSLNWSDIPDTVRFYRTGSPGDGILVIWQVSYVFYCETRAYLYKNGVFRRVGNLAVDLYCPGCTNVRYPIDAIRAFTDGQRIHFKFTKPLVLRISQMLYPEDFYYLWENGVLKPVIRKGSE